MLAHLEGQGFRAFFRDLGRSLPLSISLYLNPSKVLYQDVLKSGYGQGSLPLYLSLVKTPVCVSIQFYLSKSWASVCSLIN